MARYVAPALGEKARRRGPSRRSIAAAAALAAVLIWWNPHSRMRPEHAGILTATDVVAFETRKASRLHRFRPHFERAATRHGLAWELLAAIAYQESQWREDAVSRTGVRGLMMLTRVTAKEMGIADRRDPAQSIDGGARYLKWLLARVPGELGADTQIALALASYHAGLRRIHEAWQASGANEWSTFETHLQSADGQACAREQARHCELLHSSVRYVQRVRAFHELM